jgi:hypothetical protein
MPILIHLLVLLIVAGIAYWIISLLPLPEPFKSIVMVVALLIILLYVLSLFVALPGLTPIR